jgi:Domain of unknown function (DUF4062)
VPLETMENFESSELSVTELCRERVRACTHYLLIIGGGYGWVPPESENGLSITELEYECALELGLPMRIYFLQPGPVHVPPEGDDQEKLERFKQRVQDTHTARPFRDATEFGEVLVRSTRDWYAEAQLLVHGLTEVRSLQAATVQAGTLHVQAPQAAALAGTAQIQWPHAAVLAGTAQIQWPQAVVQAGMVQVVTAGVDLEQQLAGHAAGVRELIALYPRVLQEELLAALAEVQAKILRTPGEFRAFLQSYRFPVRFEEDADLGVKKLLEQLMLVQYAFPDWEFQHGDETANLMLHDERWARLLFAEHDHTTMPTAILQLASSLLRGPSRKRFLQGEEPIFPHRLVMSHFFKSKDNLCEHCRTQTYSFANVLPDFAAEGDSKFFMGVENDPHTLAKLDRTRVSCDACLLDKTVSVVDRDELKLRIGEVI